MFPTANHAILLSFINKLNLEIASLFISRNNIQQAACLLAGLVHWHPLWLKYFTNVSWLYLSVSVQLYLEFFIFIFSFIFFTKAVSFDGLIRFHWAIDSGIYWHVLFSLLVVLAAAAACQWSAIFNVTRRSRAKAEKRKGFHAVHWTWNAIKFFYVDHIFCQFIDFILKYGKG